MKFCGTTPVKTQQLVVKTEIKFKVILTFVVNLKACWATFKKQKWGGGLSLVTKNTGCTTIKLLQQMETEQEKAQASYRIQWRGESKTDRQVILRTTKTGH